MVIIFMSEDDIDAGVGVYHLLCRPVSDFGGPQIPSPMTLPALCAGDIDEGGEDHHDLCLHLSHVQCRLTKRRPIIIGVTVNVNKVAVDLGLNLERSIHYLDLDPPALLHGGRPVLTYWSGPDHVSIAELVIGVVTS